MCRILRDDGNKQWGAVFFLHEECEKHGIVSWLTIETYWGNLLTQRAMAFPVRIDYSGGTAGDLHPVPLFQLQRKS